MFSGGWLPPRRLPLRNGLRFALQVGMGSSVGTSPSRRPQVRTAEINPAADTVVEVTDLVRANRTFLALAEALRLTEEMARKLLKTALDEVGAHPGNVTTEDVWFMMPRIETDVIAFFENQDATVRRDQLHELVRRSRYESRKTAPRPAVLANLGYARTA
jgi:hypothetical protein